MTNRQTFTAQKSEADEFEYYRDMAREICRTARHKPHVSDDEILVLAIVASQLALRNYLEPGQSTEQEALSEILAVIDNKKVIQALRGKMADLLSGRISPARPDAPSGEEIAAPTSCVDPDEPAA